MTVCPFCDIANERASAVIVGEDSDIVAFLATSYNTVPSAPAHTVDRFGPTASRFGGNETLSASAE